MAKNKVRRKPTAKEMASAIIEINKKVNDCYSVVRELDNIIGLYIKMKGDMEKFNAFLEKQVKEGMENDSKANEEPDKENIQTDSGDEGSGAEGVREKTE